MKKLNEGPRVHSDHTGHHLKNADGEIVQSFKKDREGLKHARQSMYKNFKGLNMKKPEPEQSVDETINEDSYSQYVELAKRNNATTYEQVIDLLSQQGLSEEEMYNIADYVMNVIEESQQTTEETVSEEFTVLPSAVSQKGDYGVLYSIHEPLQIARITRWANKNNIKIQKYDTNKFVIHGNKSKHSSMVSFLRNKGIRGDATVLNPLITGKDHGIHNDSDIRQAYSIDSNGHLAIDDAEDGYEDLGFDISSRMQQKIHQNNQRYYEDKKMAELENKLKEHLEEHITVNTTSTNEAGVEDNVTVTANGADAMELVQMLKMAGIGGQAEAQVEVPAEEMPCTAEPIDDIDDMANMIKIIPLDDIEAVEEEAELANAPDEKYADTDTLVNKISGGLNRQKKSYAKAEDGDNPMAVTESEEELTARLLKEYDEFKVTAPEDSDEGDWEIENVGKWAVKIGNSQDTEATDAELGFDTELASALADEAMAEADEELNEDDVEEGIKIIRKADGKCIGGHCDEKKESPEDFEKEKGKPKAPNDKDALDKEMSEDVGTVKNS